MDRLTGGTGQLTLASGTKFVKEEGDAALLTELIVDLLPFIFAQRPGRHASMEPLVPKSYTPPSRTWFAQALKAEYVENRGLVAKALKSDRFCSKFALSFDGWRASIQAKVMYAAKIHFLTDDMVPVELPLSIDALPDKRAQQVARGSGTSCRESVSTR